MALAPDPHEKAREEAELKRHYDNAAACKAKADPAGCTEEQKNSVQVVAQKEQEKAEEAQGRRNFWYGVGVGMLIGSRNNNNNP